MEHRKQPPRNPGLGTHDSVSDLVECPACAGEGQVFPGVEVNLWASGQLHWPDALQAETCEVCQGTGEVDPDTAARWEEEQRAALEEGDLEGTD
jgi:DnaJ-class molecular chaperone